MAGVTSATLFVGMWRTCFAWHTEDYDLSVLQCVAVCCSVLQCVAVCCSVLQCGAVWCSVVQCGAVWCSVMHGSAVWCDMVRCGEVRFSPCLSSPLIHTLFLCTQRPSHTHSLMQRQRTRTVLVSLPCSHVSIYMCMYINMYLCTYAHIWM